MVSGFGANLQLWFTQQCYSAGTAVSEVTYTLVGEIKVYSDKLIQEVGNYHSLWC